MAEPKELQFECALAELLEAGVSTDMRPAVEFMCDDPANLGECFAQLPAAAREELSKEFLPEGEDDATRLQNPVHPRSVKTHREVEKRVRPTFTPLSSVHPRSVKAHQEVEKRVRPTFTPQVVCACSV